MSQNKKASQIHNPVWNQKVRIAFFFKTNKNVKKYFFHRQRRLKKIKRFWVSTSKGLDFFLIFFQKRTKYIFFVRGKGDIYCSAKI